MLWIPNAFHCQLLTETKRRICRPLQTSVCVSNVSNKSYVSEVRQHKSTFAPAGMEYTEREWWQSPTAAPVWSKCDFDFLQRYTVWDLCLWSSCNHCICCVTHTENCQYFKHVWMYKSKCECFGWFCIEWCNHRIAIFLVELTKANQQKDCTRLNANPNRPVMPVLNATPGKQDNSVHWQAKRQRSGLERQRMVPGCCGGFYSLLLTAAARTLC